MFLNGSTSGGGMQQKKTNWNVCQNIEIARLGYKHWHFLFYQDGCQNIEIARLGYKH